MVATTCYPSTQETDGGRCRAQGQALSKKKQNKTKTNNKKQTNKRIQMSNTVILSLEKMQWDKAPHEATRRRQLLPASELNAWSPTCLQGCMRPSTHKKSVLWELVGTSQCLPHNQVTPPLGAGMAVPWLVEERCATGFLHQWKSRPGTCGLRQGQILI